MKKALFILITLLFVSCNENQNKTKELAQTPTPIKKEVEVNIDELLSQETIDVPQVQKLLSNGKTLPTGDLVQFINGEIEKIISDSNDINYEKLYQLYTLGFVLSDAQDRYKEELEKDEPNFYLLGTYLLYGANIDTLNSKGKDITKIRDKDNRTILYATCSSGYIDLVKKLIEKNMDINFEKTDGRTYMHAAFNSKNGKDIIDILLKAGFNLEKTGLNSLMLASAFDSKENIQKLLEEGIDVNKKDKIGATSLMIASRNNKAEVIETLIKAGANINEKDKSGWSALIYASGYNSKEVVESLIKAGANVNEKYKDGKTALMVASVFNSKVEVIENLIKAGANVNAKDKAGMTALMAASSFSGKTEVIESLIRAGANINEKSKNGATALLIAGGFSDKEVVEILIKAGANVNEKDVAGWTALMVASQENKVEAIESLIEAGANIDEKNKKGRTALIIASQENNVKIIESLIKAGANVSEKDNYGKTAYDIAKNNNYDIPILEEKMIQAYIPNKTSYVYSDVKKQYQLENMNGYVLLFESLWDAKEAYTFNLQKDFRAINKFVNAPKNRYEQQILVEDGREPIEIYLMGYTHKDESNVIEVRKVGSTKTYWTFKEYLKELHNVTAPIYTSSKLMNVSANYGRTALTSASQSNNIEIVEELIKSGVNVNEIDNNGRTALISASKSNNIEIVKMLIKAGADVNAKDINGKTALTFASQGNNVEIGKILIKAGADVGEKTAEKSIEPDANADAKPIEKKKKVPQCKNYHKGSERGQMVPINDKMQYVDNNGCIL